MNPRQITFWPPLGEHMRFLVLGVSGGLLYIFMETRKEFFSVLYSTNALSVDHFPALEAIHFSHEPNCKLPQFSFQLAPQWLPPKLLPSREGNRSLRDRKKRNQPLLASLSPANATRRDDRIYVCVGRLLGPPRLGAPNKCSSVDTNYKKIWLGEAEILEIVRVS